MWSADTQLRYKTSRNEKGRNDGSRRCSEEDIPYTSPSGKSYLGIIKDSALIGLVEESFNWPERNQAACKSAVDEDRTEYRHVYETWPSLTQNIISAL